MTIKEALKNGFLDPVKSTTKSKYQPGDTGKIVCIKPDCIGVNFGDGFVIYYFKAKPREKKLSNKRYINELEIIKSKDDGKTIQDKGKE